MNGVVSASALIDLAKLSPSLAPPVTICVLCYGDHAPLARRFLSSLYSNTDSRLFRLRIGLNEVVPATCDAIASYSEEYGNIEVFPEARNIFKSPMMRRMFWERPIETRWTIWCDDDAEFIRKDWLIRLAQRIEVQPHVAMWGSIHYCDIPGMEVPEWIRRAKWYLGIPFEMQEGPEEDPAVRILFCEGGFWAVKTSVLRALDWPDPRLIQSCEDMMLGEALRQSQFAIEDFQYGVLINHAKRRNPTAREVTTLF